MEGVRIESQVIEGGGLDHSKADFKSYCPCFHLNISLGLTKLELPAQLHLE